MKKAKIEDKDSANPLLVGIGQNPPKTANGFIMLEENVENAEQAQQEVDLIYNEIIEGLKQVKSMVDRYEATKGAEGYSPDSINTYCLTIYCPENKKGVSDVLIRYRQINQELNPDFIPYKEEIEKQIDEIGLPEGFHYTIHFEQEGGNYPYKD